MTFTSKPTVSDAMHVSRNSHSFSRCRKLPIRGMFRAPEVPGLLDEADLENLANELRSILSSAAEVTDSTPNDSVPDGSISAETASNESVSISQSVVSSEQLLDLARYFHPAGRGFMTTSPNAPTPDEVFAHVPVMKVETLAAIAPVGNGLVIDATLGGAGHTRAILDTFPDVTVLGLDRDPFAIAAATARLKSYGARAIVRQCRYDDIVGAVAEQANVLPVRAVFFDLGVSSAQLDLAERGFSYRNDAPLDMRMDTTQGITAADVCNTYSERDLSRVLHVYGDEKFSGRVARAIIANRPLTNTVQLAEIVTNAIPAATRRTGGHPAKRTFQALRIEVNDELRVLERALDAALDVLAPGGRCIVLSYHSGEDRIVKDRFRLAETGGCTCPDGLPCVCGALPRGRMLRRGVTRPTEAEIASNPRAASAVARIFVMAGSAGFPSLAAEPAHDEASDSPTPSSKAKSKKSATRLPKTSGQAAPVMARARRGEASRTSSPPDESSSAATLPRSKP